MVTAKNLAMISRFSLLTGFPVAIQSPGAEIQFPGPCVEVNARPAGSYPNHMNAS